MLIAARLTRRQRCFQKTTSERCCGAIQHASSMWSGFGQENHERFTTVMSASLQATVEVRERGHHSLRRSLSRQTHAQQGHMCDNEKNIIKTIIPSRHLVWLVDSALTSPIEECFAPYLRQGMAEEPQVSSHAPARFRKNGLK